MSIRLLGHAAKSVDSRSARSRQRKVGASEIGVCRRRAGYSHHGTPYTDPENVSGLPAVAGTWMHKGALDTMRREWGSLIETTVEDDMLRGHVDAIELPNEWRRLAGLAEIDDAPDVIEVDDLKTKRDGRAISYVRIRGPKRSELYQVHLYADLLRRGMVGPLEGGRVKKQETALRAAIAASGGEGLPVERIRLRFFPRTGEEDVEYPHEQDFDEDIAGEAWEWVEQVARSSTPDDLPRDQDGPGLSIVCDHCPFLTACWGPGANGIRPQAQLIVTDPDLAGAMAEYDAGRALEAEGKRQKDVARAKLDGTDAAIYTGDEGKVAFKLGWSGGREVPASEEPDLEAMVALFKEADLTVPMKEVPAKTTPRTISVVPWDAPDAACGKPTGAPIPWQEDPDLAGDWWIQDRPRGGWTLYRVRHEVRPGEFGYDHVQNEVTAGAFAKRFPGYVDPRPSCVLKPKHSGDCRPPSYVRELDLSEVPE